MEALALPLKILLGMLAAAAGAWDLKYRRIPNWVTMPGLVLGLTLSAGLGGTAGLKSSAAGIGLASLIYLPLLLMRGRGAGDLKLMAAVGAIAGWRNWLVIFILTALLGGLFAIVLLLYRGGLGRALRNVACILGDLARLRMPYARRPELDVAHPRAVTMPHGAVIALVCFFVLPAL